MGNLNGWQFRLITYRYKCHREVITAARESISNSYYPSQNPQLGGCFVTITDNAKRWLFPRRKDRFFRMVFLFRSVPVKRSVTKEPYLQVNHKGAVELTYEEFERRSKVKPEEKVLIEARKIINPVYETKYEG